MSAAADRLAELLDTFPARLAEFSDTEASEKSAGWSKKEILGHLIDSASNNHQRFVRAAIDPHIDFPRYQQDTWVSAQRYNHEPWSELAALWLALNRHLVHVMHSIPFEARDHTVSIGGNKPVTLGFLIDDYVDHLEHHLDQILP